MKKIASIIFLSALSAAANAQITGRYTWQLSTDNGTTWGSDALVVAGATVKVRLLASWTGIADTLGVGYAGGQFDARILSNATIGAISNIDRPVPFNFAPQTLVASAITGGMKIDTAADVLGIGLGTGWVNPGQAAHFANPAAFNGTNGAVVFSYDMIAGADNTTFDCVLNSTTGRAMAVYSNSTGTQIRISASAVTVVGASFIPTPGPLALLGLGGLTIARRRR